MEVDDADSSHNAVPHKSWLLPDRWHLLEEHTQMQILIRSKLINAL